MFRRVLPIYQTKIIEIVRDRAWFGLRVIEMGDERIVE